MKRLTLNETWKQCLAMWKWIAKQIRAGDNQGIYGLKVTWVKKHGIKVDELQGNCFFCEYTRRDKHRGKRDNCRLCPARKINKLFHCNKLPYNYLLEPRAFYKELLRLNRIRLKKRK